MEAGPGPKTSMAELFFLDMEQCKQCTGCVLECPFELIALTKDGYPTLRRAARKHCIACGHCVTVCPRSALTLRLLPEGEAQVIETDLLPDPEQVALFIKSRRSIRSFKKRKVDRAVLEELMDVARYAPSAKNAQPVRWRVYSDDREIQRLAGLTVDWMAGHKLFPGIVKAWEQGEDKVLRHCPHLILASAPETGENPAEDCAIAVSYLELAAHSHGVGACWAGFLMSAAEHSEAVRQALNLPEGVRAYSALMLGFPKFRYHAIPPRKPLNAEWID